MRELNFEALRDRKLHECRTRLPLWSKLLIALGTLLLLLLICIAARYIGYADSAWGPWYNRVY